MLIPPSFNDKPNDNQNQSDAGLRILAVMIARLMMAPAKTPNHQVMGQTPPISKKFP